ncbi:MAG: phosphatase PAP2 family protein [Ezakiella massiliensis]|uniref:phosphatase PAP2 family protein n=1 Tax=Ezakiella massiliensis TaxID=1852374 RepID=UPI00094F1ECB|nr:phosphatase PAP2 family protein [Ezakiella massiliensis]
MKDYKAYSKVLIGLLVFFALMATLVVFGLTNDLDHDFGQAFLLKSPGAFKIVKAFTSLFNPLMATGIGIVITLIFFACKKFWQGALVGLSLGIGALVNFLAKILIRMERPAYKLIDEAGFSFPSGHSNAAAAISVALMLVVENSKIDARTKRILKFLLGLFMFAMAMSRIMVGVHFLSDILAGLSLGAASALAIYMGIYKFKNRTQAKS